jgi:hypothetical protein
MRREIGTIQSDNNRDHGVTLDITANLRALRPERYYLRGNINKINNLRTSLTTVIAVCSRVLWSIGG